MGFAVEHGETEKNSKGDDGDKHSHRSLVGLKEFASDDEDEDVFDGYQVMSDQKFSQLYPNYDGQNCVDECV